MYHGPGEDPFEAVMCTVRAASQISLLMENSIFNTRYHLLSRQDFSNQMNVYRALHCAEIYVIILERKFSS